uniref:lysozyme n=1 Tax=Cacopsylla melanoneura TaxID=428564 RepID=A0A8D9FJS0_9HEMI
MARCELFTLAILATVCFFVQVNAQSQPIDQICLGCICHGMSLCNQTIGCNGDTCGAFKITWAYWSDAGKPTINGIDPNSAEAYSRCTSDAVCAGKAVEKYMTKYSQDCNGDGTIDCRDFAAIHRLGGYGCNAPLDPTYLGRFDKCLQDVSQLNG